MAYSKTWTSKLLFPRTTVRTEHYAPLSPVKTVVNHYNNITHVKTGTKVDGWKTKLARNQDASSNYTRRGGRILRLQPAKQSGRVINLQNPSIWTNVEMTYNFDEVSIPPSVSAVDYSESDRLAMKTYYSNLAEAMEQFQSIPFIKEFKQTKQLLGETAFRLFNTFYSKGKSLKSYARRLKRQGFPWRTASRDISSRWLEYQFGMKPLISDLDGLLELMSNGMPNDSFVIRGTGRHIPSRVIDGHQVASFPIAINVTGYRQTSAVSRLAVGIRVKPSLFNSVGLSLRSIPGAVWEVTPWSFLVDYFYDVQGWLNSKTYGSLPFVYGVWSRTTTLKLAYSGAAAPVTQSNYTRSQISNGFIDVELKHFNRSVLNAMPTYVPSVELAGPLKGMRWANVASLLALQIEPWVKR